MALASPALADWFGSAHALLPRRDDEIEVEQAGHDATDHRGHDVDEQELADAVELTGHDRRAEAARRVEARAGARRDDHHEHAERGADRERSPFLGGARVHRHAHYHPDQEEGADPLD